MSSRSKFINLSTVFMLLCIPSFTHAQSDDNAFALEIFQQAVADDSCEMYQIVIDDYPETTAAKLAKIKLRTCGGAAVVEPEPEPEDPPIDEPAPGDPGFEHLDDENRLSCNGFWNGARCIKNRRELVRNLQRAYVSLGCPVGSADGVWGRKTSRAVRVSNLFFGDNFRRSSSSRAYGRQISKLFSTDHSICSCPPNKYLDWDGICKISTPVVPDDADVGGPTCGWFALTVCSRQKREANKASNRYGGYTIFTQRARFPNFSAGYYCSVQGPTTKTLANRAKNRARSLGAGSAYIKNSCR